MNLFNRMMPADYAYKLLSGKLDMNFDYLFRSSYMPV